MVELLKILQQLYLLALLLQEFQRLVHKLHLEHWLQKLLILDQSDVYCPTVILLKVKLLSHLHINQLLLLILLHILLMISIITELNMLETKLLQEL